jgi:hypothetical protein
MKAVLKVPIPYGLFMEPGYSAYVLPALMHSPFLDKLFVYPGVVDYDKGFSTCNFIASPLHACELIIPAGTPLLQVIPFKLVNYHAVCGAASQREIDCNRFGFPSRVLGYYRKMFHQKKIYTSEVSK